MEKSLGLVEGIKTRATVLFCPHSHNHGSKVDTTLQILTHNYLIAALCPLLILTVLTQHIPPFTYETVPTDIYWSVALMNEFTDKRIQETSWAPTKWQPFSRKSG